MCRPRGMLDLHGKVALVTGATRGVGKGIAIELAKAGATVYITGRTLKCETQGIGGSLEETEKEISDQGGSCIPIQCDHSSDDDVGTVFKRIESEQSGVLDILVNNVFGGVVAISENAEKRFWETPLGLWDTINDVGLRSHYICSHYAANMMVERRRGLIVNISSIGGILYLFNPVYGVGKCAVDRMTADMAVELRPHGVSCVTLYPGLVATEHMLNFTSQDYYEVPSALRDNMESPRFSGRCVVALARDPKIMRKTGSIQMSTDVGDEYGLTDIDGKSRRNNRSVALLLQTVGWRKTAWLFPDCIRIPRWVVWVWFNRFSSPAKPMAAVKKKRQNTERK